MAQEHPSGWWNGEIRDGQVQCHFNKGERQVAASLCWKINPGGEPWVHFEKKVRSARRLQKFELERTIPAQFPDDFFCQLDNRRIFDNNAAQTAFGSISKIGKPEEKDATDTKAEQVSTEEARENDDSTEETAEDLSREVQEKMEKDESFRSRLLICIGHTATILKKLW